jgi:hypothetical protein
MGRPLPAGQEHGRTIPLAKIRAVASLNHLVGLGEQRGRHGKAETSGGLQI